MKYIRYHEFVESFARACEFLSYPSEDQIIVKDGENFTYDHNAPQFKNEVLVHKIENVF